MLSGVWGRKIGMTQVFSEKNDVVPVTVIDLNNWFVTAIKTKENDGYDAVQLGLLKKRYHGQPFDAAWLKKPKKHFLVFREVVLVSNEKQSFEIGQSLDVDTVLSQGAFVDVCGVTKGKGFQGVVKRHGFSGGPKSHGSNLGRKPGAIGFQRATGRVIKGQKLPGHMGAEQRTIKKLEIVRIEKDEKMAMIKGSVPGSAGSLVFMQKVQG